MATAVASPVHYSVPGSEYYGRVALSNSGMKDLAVSPLHYWWKNLNPSRVEAEPSAEQRFGTALHCLVLEGESVFNDRYAPALNRADHPECLETVNDIRAWIKAQNITPKGALKSELIAQAHDIDPKVKIWEVIKANHAQESIGRELLCPDEWNRLQGCAEAIQNEPRIQAILSDGSPEVSIFSTDPDTGVPQKARLDWLAPKCILDFKTFTARRGKSIDECVSDAIYYERYYQQAYFYSVLHQRATEANKPLPFVIAFVESDPPHEVRIRELRPTNHDIAVLNVYWTKARIDVQYFCKMWRNYMDEFGVERPWRKAQRIEVLRDEELRGMAY